MVSEETLTRYWKEQAASTRRIMARIAAEQPLAYLCWLEYAKASHDECGRADCPICHHIEAVHHPLSDALEECPV